MSENDGGPAFEYNVIKGGKTGDGKNIECKNNTKYSGISVRDYFESMQTAAIISGLMHRHKDPGYSDKEMIYEAVRLGMIAADAMMEERDK